MKKVILAAFSCILFFSCAKENVSDIESQDLNAVKSTIYLDNGAPPPVNCDDIIVNPLHLFSSFGTVERENQFGNPTYLSCSNLSGYASIFKSANYDRIVKVNYVIKDSKFPFQQELIGVEDYIVPANKRVSATRPILRNLGFEVNGELTSSVESVRRRSNGEIITCFRSTSQKFDFINCFSDPSRQGPGLKPSGPEPDCDFPFCDPLNDF